MDLTDPSYMPNQQRKYESAANEGAKEYNETERQASAQMLLVGTFALTISSTLIASNLGSFLGADLSIRIAILAGSSLILVSMAIGLMQYLLAMRFLSDWIESSGDIANQISDSSIKTPDELSVAVRNRFVKFRKKQGLVMLVLQGILLFGGIIAYALAIVLAFTVKVVPS